MSQAYSFCDGTIGIVVSLLCGRFPLPCKQSAVEFSHSFAGGIRGWKDADFKITTNKAAINVETFVGYVHLSKAAAKTYSVWNAER